MICLPKIDRIRRHVTSMILEYGLRKPCHELFDIDDSLDDIPWSMGLVSYVYYTVPTCNVQVVTITMIE